MKKIEKLKSEYLKYFQNFKPVIYNISIQENQDKISTLIQNGEITMVHDHIEPQLRELIKLRNPKVSLSEVEYQNELAKICTRDQYPTYGVWVHYPWKKLLVHVLDEHEFVEVRTNRNRNKITGQEQATLSTKTVAIIGLSVGNSIALTIAMERTCGKIKLADFDTIELSNLNRIRAGIDALSQSKAVTAARQIAEIDPFLQVEILDEAITKENIEKFLSEGEKNIDLLVEVCDNLEVKIMSRIYARNKRIPVIMDTSDRGMIDIERFDLENGRAIFHGFLPEEELDLQGFVIPDDRRMETLQSIVDYDKLSDRMKMSMAEIRKTISTWPQLASSVALGGGATTDICRKILLNQHTKSGRYYVDIDQIFSG